MDKPVISDLRDHLGYHRRKISNAVSYSFARKFAAREVSIAEWVILREMYSNKDSLSASQIATLMGLTRGAISKLVDNLLNKCLVIRTTALQDRRYQDIQLTDKGISLIPELAAIADDNDAHFFCQLSTEEYAALLIKLAVLHELNADPTE